MIIETTLWVDATNPFKAAQPTVRIPVRGNVEAGKVSNIEERDHRGVWHPISAHLAFGASTIILRAAQPRKPIMGGLPASCLIFSSDTSEEEREKVRRIFGRR
jgi:hypothetical protein